MDSLLADTLHQNYLTQRKNTGNAEDIKHTQTTSVQSGGTDMLHLPWFES